MYARSTSKHDPVAHLVQRAASIFPTFLVALALCAGCGRIGYESSGLEPLADASQVADGNLPAPGPDAGDRSDGGQPNTPDGGTPMTPDGGPVPVDAGMPPDNNCTPPCGAGELCCSNMCVPDFPAPC